MRRPVDSSAIRREGGQCRRRQAARDRSHSGSVPRCPTPLRSPPLELDFNTDEGDGPVGLDSKVLNAAGVVQAKAVQEPLQGRQAWARIQESARLRDGLSAGRRASGWSGEELRSRPGRRPPQNKVLGSRGCSTCFDSKHSGRQASCIQAFEPVWLREKRLGFWQETASCPLTRFIITHCVVDPTTFLVGSETEGWMTSVAGIVEYIARTEGPDTSAAVGADIENGRLDETLAGFGSWCRPYSYKLGGVWQTYIRGIFKDPAPDVGPFLVQPHTKGKGKRTRNSAPAFLPPQPPATAPSSAPASSASTRCCRARSGPRYPDERRRGPERLRELGLLRERRRPQPLPGPGAEATAFRAELEAGFRAERMSAAEAVESWRAFEDGTVELAKGLGYSYRRAPVPTSYARRAAREASRAKIDAAEEQAAREEAEDNARFRHLHH
eukprot:tig00000823_g4532.t1